MTQRDGFSEAANTLLQAKWILVIGIVMVFFTPYLFTRHSFINELDFTNTGQIGDTIGGISAPIVSLLGSVLVFLALKAQTQATNLAQIQIDDQRSRYYVDRITDIIYQQLDRINESIKAQSFELPRTFSAGTEGYSGLYAFNEAIKEKAKQDGLPVTLDELITGNVNQLTEIYENTSTAVTIIDNLLNDSALKPAQQHELRKLLVLNLGTIMRDNAAEMNKFIRKNDGRVADLASIRPVENQVGQLKQSVAVVYAFFDEVLTTARLS